jgi:hypothetical protein
LLSSLVFGGNLKWFKREKTKKMFLINLSRWSKSNWVVSWQCCHSIAGLLRYRFESDLQSIFSKTTLAHAEVATMDVNEAVKWDAWQQFLFCCVVLRVMTCQQFELEEIDDSDLFWESF